MEIMLSFYRYVSPIVCTDSKSKNAYSQYMAKRTTWDNISQWNIDLIPMLTYLEREALLLC
jgi:hypothetical protein